MTNITPQVSRHTLALLFLRVGSQSFGGWSTTVVLLEKELAKLTITADVKSATAYGQVLPGATQVAIVSNVGYQLRGLGGALIATVSYLLPALALMFVFAVVYFQYLQGTDILKQLDGLVAALAGIILANAYRIGKKHTPHSFFWLFVLVACIAQLIFHVHAFLVIVLFGVAGFVATRYKRTSQGPPE